MLNDYALIIGVESYRAFDPGGGSDVPGALNDARALIHECLAMGFSPERIRVLSSPVLTAAAVGVRAEGIRFGEATREEIAAGLTWIYGELARPEPSVGLCTFSGHGLMSPGLVLCPADFDGSAGSLVPVAQVRDQLGDSKAAHNLTVLLDCCHAQARADSTRNVSARLAALAPGLGGGGEIPERLLAACRTDQTSVSSRFGGVMAGAFTWAATAAMGQWKATKEDGVARLDVSYGELRDRTRALLSALSFEQETVLSGPPGVARLPFLHPGRRGAAGEAVETPDAPRTRRQITPEYGTIVASYTSGLPNATFGNIYATGSNRVTIANYAAQQSTEYWYLDPSLVAQLAGGLISSLAFDTTPMTSSGGTYTPSVQAAPLVFGEVGDWTPVSAPVLPGTGQTSVFFFRATPTMVYLQFILDSASEVVAINWYQQSALNFEASGTFTAVATPTFLVSGWDVSNSPLLGVQYSIQSELSTAGSPWYLSVPAGTPAAGTGLVLSSTPTLWLFDTATGGIRLAANPSLAQQSQPLGTQQRLASYSTRDVNQQWTWSTRGYGFILLRVNGGAAIGSDAANHVDTVARDDTNNGSQKWQLVFTG